MLNFKDYLVPATDNQNQESMPPTQESTEHDMTSDEILTDLRNLFDGGLDADDRMMETFLSSNSRSISEYTGHGPGSPGAQSTNSIDISDSDYRTRRGLDRDARDIRDMPMPASPLGRGTAAANISEPQFDPSVPAPSERVMSPSRNLRSTLTASKSPSFIAARQVFEKAQHQPEAAREPIFKANGRTPNTKPADVREHMRSASRQEAASEADTVSVPPSSPELGMPTPNAVVSPVGFGGPSKDTNYVESQELQSRSKPNADIDLPELSDDEVDYPDPITLLESRSPQPMYVSPLQNNGVNEADSDADVEQSSDRGSRQSSSSATRRMRRTGPWGGLGKRRRDSNNESGYGNGALPVVVDRRATLPAEPALILSAPELPQQPGNGRNRTAQRAYSHETVMTPVSRRVRALAQTWSTPKRIRMSGTESSDNDSDDNRARLPRLEPPVSAPAAIIAEGSSARGLAGQRPSSGAVVLAKESSSYPTVSSSAPHVPSSHESGAVAHVSQTPEIPSSAPTIAVPGAESRDMSPELSSSSLSSSESDRMLPGVVSRGSSPVNSMLWAPLSNGMIDSDDSDVDMSGEKPAEVEAAPEEPSELAQNGATDTAEPRLVETHVGSGENFSKADSSFTIDTPVADDEAAGVEAANEKAVDDASANEEPVDDEAVGEVAASKEAVCEDAASEDVASCESEAMTTPRIVLKTGAVTQPQPGRQRRSTVSRRITMCQRLLQLSNARKDNGEMDIHLDPALAPPARLLGSDLRSSAFSIDAMSAPSTPTRRAAFSGAMRVLGEGDPIVADSDRLRYMCKVKGLIEGTQLPAREALRVLYFFTGDWVNAR
ncbi:hypothetical protein GGF43_003986, partial [Coemansia sp. RSA 2618]